MLDKELDENLIRLLVKVLRKYNVNNNKIVRIFQDLKFYYPDIDMSIVRAYILKIKE